MRPKAINIGGVWMGDLRRDEKGWIMQIDATMLRVTSADLLSQSTFRRKVFAKLGVAMRPVHPEIWIHAMKQLMPDGPRADPDRRGAERHLRFPKSKWMVR
jgi:hypothetical protein